MKTIIPDESYFQSAISFEHGNDFIRPWRIPFEEYALYATHGELLDKAGRTAGVRLRFQTNSPVVELEARLESDDPMPTVDLVCEGELLASEAAPVGSDTIRFEGLGGQTRIYELWLPVFAQSYVKALRVAEDAAIDTVEDERFRWITYGSSITHCRSCTSPARTWPAVAARAHGLNMISLGYGGNCHLEPMIARLIRDLPADLITLKLGINVYGLSSLNMRTFCAAVIGMVKIIREKHPVTPIGLITPIYGCERETNPNAVGMTLENYRGQVRAAHEALCSLGDEKLFLFEGRDLLWKEEAHLLPDNLHPNGEGYERMGRRVADKVIPRLLKETRKNSSPCAQLV